jgi:hypothetical protein
MELIPSEPHALGAETRFRGLKDAAVRVVPLTPVQTAKDWEITDSISFKRLADVWACVITVTGEVLSAVLHRKEIVPGPVT